MKEHTYGDFPTLQEIKRDYYELMEIIKEIRTIKQAKDLQGKGFIVEINGESIEDYINEGYADSDIEWIRYENYGCLWFIYDRFDGKPMFDIWSNFCFDDFITDITIDKLTEELYQKAKSCALKAEE